MKKIYDSGVLHILPVENGFIFVALQGEYADKAIVMYRHWELSSGKITPITRSVYLLNKFGNGFEQFENKPSDFLNLRTTDLPDHSKLILHPSGESSILNINGSVSWSGKMLYHSHGPSSAAFTDRGLWVSYPEGNAIVRYNLRNMREDLRIGSEHSEVLKTPESLCPIESNKMLVCTGRDKKILNIDLQSYVISEYASLKEPIHQYLRVQYDEIVLLDSGIYVL